MQLKQRYQAPSRARSHRSLLKSPYFWFTIALLIVLFTVPLLNKPRTIISTLYTDVSASNQPYQAEVVALCKARLNALRSRDVLIDAQFADRPALRRNTTYNLQQQGELQADCKDILQPDPEIAKQPGTSIHAALNHWQTKVQHLRSQNDLAPIVAVFVVQAAEVSARQPQINWTHIKQQIKATLKPNDVLLIVGAGPSLQNQWSNVLSDRPRTKVVPYRDGKAAVKWAFNQARNA